MAQLDQIQHKQTNKTQTTCPNITNTLGPKPKKRKPVEEGIHASHHVDGHVNERPAFWDTRQRESRRPSTGDCGEIRRNSAVK